MSEVVAAVLIIPGALLALLAGIGLFRFEDVFSRMHAASKPATLGLALVLGGATLLVDDIGSVTKLVLVIGLQFVTAPVGGHLVGRSTHRAGEGISDRLDTDELAVARAESESDLT